MIGRNASAGMQRRDFLKVSVAASGGLLIGFRFPGISALASAESSATTFMPNAFVRIQAELPEARMVMTVAQDHHRCVVRAIENRYVHIIGQVNDPGLYALHDGDRAVDVVAAAGGLTPSADPAALNLARFLSDGEQIIVPAVGQSVPASGAGGGGTAIPGKVNINTADEPTLETLPRVGPAMAATISGVQDAMQGAREGRTPT